MRCRSARPVPPRNRDADGLLQRFERLWVLFLGLDNGRQLLRSSLFADQPEGNGASLSYPGYPVDGGLHVVRRVLVASDDDQVLSA